MISVWRISFCTSPLPTESALLQSQGLGSTLYEGRWHSKTGMPIAYCSSSHALCQLEKRVHAGGRAVKGQILMRLDLPKSATLDDVAKVGLPADWRTDVAATRRIGDGWLSGNSSLGLWVPSAVEPLERKLLLNPAHSQYVHIRLTVERDPFVFDPRLF